MKTSSLYVASLEPESGSLVVSLGIMQLLKSSLGRVAYFKPIIHTKERKESDIIFMQEYFNLDTSYEDSYCYDLGEIEQLQAQNKYDEILSTILQHYKRLLQSHDFVLCHGLNRAEYNAIFDFYVDLDIAKNLQIPFLSVLNAQNKSAKELIEVIQIEDACVRENSCSHFGTFINRLDQKNYDALLTYKENNLPDLPIFLLPEVEELDKPTLLEVQNFLDAKLLYGKESDLNRVIHRVIVASMRLEHYLEHIEDGDLVIVSGDRSDILIGSLAAIYSSKFPHISGLLLSGDLKPSSTIDSMLQGLQEYMIPVLSYNQDTISTAMKVNSIKSRIRAKSDRKVALALGNFETHVDVDYLKNRLSSVSSNVMTPAMFEFSLFELAAKEKKRVVLPESQDDRILKATEILLRRGIDEIILLGNKDEIDARCAFLGIEISKATIIDPETSPLKEQFVEEFYKLREHKGLSLNAARDALEKKEYFATMMVHMNLADAMVSGAITTTADTIRPALQIIKTKKDVNIVSSLFFMCLSDKVLVYADCAVNQDPSAQELAQIAISSAQTSKAFGIEPRVAMLSYSTGESGSGEDVEKVREATKIIKQRDDSILVEGPLQYDAAIDKDVAKLKLPNSKVAGNANVLIFPDLNTGNNTYKAVQRSSGAVAIGPVLQGLNKPVNDLSRGCSVKDIINTVLITAIQATF